MNARKREPASKADHPNGEGSLSTQSRWPISGARARILPGKIAHKGVRKSVGFLRACYHKPLSVLALSKVSGMSRRGIHQAFMKHLGVPPGEVLRQMRIQRAKELLTRFDYKMKVVAARAGYRSLNTFGVAFKNATGLSPKQFQGQWRSDRNGTRRNTGALSTGIRDGLSTNLPERLPQHRRLTLRDQEPG